MSRSHDLVEIARKVSDGEMGNISIFDLSGNKRIEIFCYFAQKLHYHYSRLKGSHRFIPWETENFGEKLSEHSVRRNGLMVDDSLYPREEAYTTSTRIVVLASEYYGLPRFEKPKDGIWTLGDKKLVVRICITHDGVFWLEWYEGTVTEMYEKHPSLPKKVIVSNTKFIRLDCTICVDNKRVPDEFWKLLTKHPEIVYHFACGCIQLLQEEIKDRRERVERDAALVVKLETFGRMFGIR